MAHHEQRDIKEEEGKDGRPKQNANKKETRNKGGERISIRVRVKAKSNEIDKRFGFH